MSLQVGFLAGRIFTLFTFDQPFTTVPFLMRSQMTPASACIVTLVALVWFFTPVYSHMWPQISCLWEFKATLVAFVWFVSTNCYFCWILAMDIVYTWIINAKIVFHHHHGCCTFKLKDKDRDMLLVMVSPPLWRVFKGPSPSLLWTKKWKCFLFWKLGYCISFVRFLWDSLKPKIRWGFCSKNIILATMVLVWKTEVRLGMESRLKTSSQ